MKKFILFSMSMLLFACSKDDDSGFIAPVSHTFEVTYNENYDNNPAASAEIRLVNSDDGKSYVATTDENGMAEVEVVPGIYVVNVTRSFSPEEYLTFSGQEVQDVVTFNASMEAVAINETSATSTTIQVVTGRIGNLLIKQIYYSGSDVRMGAMYRDQFIELHNNSNEVIYLDDIYFAQIYGTGSVPSNIEEYHLPTGQYDWSLSLGQTDGEGANANYVYSDEVIKFPGTGQDYPLEPGKSVIVAATAVNHKAPLVVTDDEGETVTYEVPQPELTIDLSNASFEAYYRDYQESQGSSWLDSDIDNPNSANMEIVFKSYGGKDLILDPLGRDAFVLFTVDEEEFTQWNTIPAPNVGIDDMDEDTSNYLQIPTSTIIDGVELQRNDPSKGKPKRLPDAIDAGEISGIQGQYTSESVIRKVNRETDGKTFYQDTNNSANDFQVLNHPQVNIEQ